MSGKVIWRGLEMNGCKQSLCAYGGGNFDFLWLCSWITPTSVHVQQYIVIKLQLFLNWNLQEWRVT